MAKPSPTLQALLGLNELPQAAREHNVPLSQLAEAMIERGARWGVESAGRAWTARRLQDALDRVERGDFGDGG